MPFIYSTATCDNIFPVYSNTEEGQAHKIQNQVLVRGGAGVAQGKAEFITKYGIRTEVSDDQLKLLRSNGEFNRMVNEGWMRVDERKVNPETLAADMSQRDESAPLVPEDYDDESEVKPVVKGIEVEVLKKTTMVEDEE